MPRFALTALAFLALSAPLAAAQEATLAGVHTVYLDTDDLSVRREIARALKTELPQVSLVWRMLDADAVLGFRGTAGHTQRAASTTISYDQPVTSNSNGQATYDTRTVTVPLGQPTYTPGHVEGIFVRGDHAVGVLHQGLWTPAFPMQFAARFIRAWREANP